MKQRNIKFSVDGLDSDVNSKNCFTNWGVLLVLPVQFGLDKLSSCVNNINIMYIWYNFRSYALMTASIKCLYNLNCIKLWVPAHSNYVLFSCYRDCTQCSRYPAPSTILIICFIKTSLMSPRHSNDYIRHSFNTYLILLSNAFIIIVDA